MRPRSPVRRGALHVIALALAVAIAIDQPAFAACSEADAPARIAFLQQSFALDAAPARRWTLWWTIGFGALTIGQAVPAPFVDKATRIDFLVGAVSSAASVVYTLLTPLSAGSADRRFAAIVHAGGDGCAIAAKGRAILADAADGEAGGRGWLAQTLNVVFNAVVALWLGLGYGHWLSALESGVGGLALGEIMILTQPDGLPARLAAYDAGSFHAATDAPRVSLVLAPRYVGVSVAF